MSISSGIIIGNKRISIVSTGNSLLRCEEGKESYTIWQFRYDIKFLSGCSDGEHFAFWLGENERFYLMNINGEVIWSCRINTDRALPHYIRFSSSGDAVAFIDDYDGGHRIHFYNITKQYNTEFGPSETPIGYNANLRRFLDFLFFSQGEIIRLGICDRHKSIKSYIDWSFGIWHRLFIQDTENKFVVLKKRNILWISIDSLLSETEIADCIPKDIHSQDPCVLEAIGELALIHIIKDNFASIINRNIGIVWNGNDVLSAMLNNQKAIIQYVNGTIEIIRDDGSTEMKFIPPKGNKALAPNIVDKTLYIAYVSEEEAIKFNTYTLY